VILPAADREGRVHFTEAFKGKVWSKTIWLFVDMAIYGFIMPFFGFIISSIIFLLVGFYILGERRWILMILTAVLVVIGLWFLLSILMGVYIAPGEIFYMMGVIDV
jgi:putative tricarboxylic transport membrane protein